MVTKEREAMVVGEVMVRMEPWAQCTLSTCLASLDFSIVVLICIFKRF